MYIYINVYTYAYIIIYIRAKIIFCIITYTGIVCSRRAHTTTPHSSRRPYNDPPPTRIFGLSQFSLVRICKWFGLKFKPRFSEPFKLVGSPVPPSLTESFCPRSYGAKSTHRNTQSHIARVGRWGRREAWRGFFGVLNADLSRNYLKSCVHPPTVRPTVPDTVPRSAVFAQRCLVGGG